MFELFPDSPVYEFPEIVNIGYAFFRSKEHTSEFK
jgi:hypothetical protein